MARFEKGNQAGVVHGRPKGSKNRLTNDVRAAFHKAYDEMDRFGESGKP
jgi:hypothetical protein